MGAMFRPKYAPPGWKYTDAKAAGVLRESEVWWVRFRQHGKTIRQSTETTSETKARAFLREREGKVALNIPVSPQGDRLTLDEAAAIIRDDYKQNDRRSSRDLEIRLAHLFAHLGRAARLGRLVTRTVEIYKTARLKEGAAPATVNRELATLRRMATLVRAQVGLVVPFTVTMFEERNARKGFFELEAFDAVCRKLRPELAALAQAACITGWRKSELRSRQWPHVDFDAGWIRLEPEETKNREGRQFPLIPELRSVLEAQRARVKAIEKETKQIIPWIFCRDDGAPVGDFKKAWATACVAAGFFRVVPVGSPPAEGQEPKVRKVPTKLFHDFRRTAVRNLVRAGIPETTAMAMTGHKTRAVFKRYAIVDEGMLQEAGAKLAAAATLQRSKVGGETGKVIAIDR